MRIFSIALILIFFGCFPSGTTENKFLQNVRDGNTAIVRALLERNRISNLNAADSTASTALMIASERGYTEIVKLLLAHGASTVPTNIQGKSAFDLARESGHIQIIELLEHTSTTRKKGDS